MRILYLYLNAFSAIGGIQKFNKNFLRALSEIEFMIVSNSLYDLRNDLPVINNTKLYSAENNKLKFIINSLKFGFNSDIIVLGHINLTFPLVIFYKLLFPQKEIILITHGIEIWQRLSFLKKYSLNKCDKIITVSNYTKKRIIEVQGIKADKIYILHNTIDENFKPYQNKERPIDLLKKHKLTGNEKIILTVCRLSSSEKYKGYDRIIKILPKLLNKYPSLRYILAGKGDQTEIKRLSLLVKDNKVEKNVIITGYVFEEDLPKYYNLCDVFILASRKEGFGIVFLEALISGKPVIGGNMDGSVDALLNGKLGTLINPENDEEIYESIVTNLNKDKEELTMRSFEIKSMVEEAFGFGNFKNNIFRILCNKPL